MKSFNGCQVERKEHSRTSQPAPAEFLDIYRELSASGSSIISIHLSTALSGALPVCSDGCGNAAKC